MTLSLSHGHIYTDDPDASLAFYRDTLGLEVKNEVVNDGFRWITLSTADQPEIAIVLSQPHADGPRSSAIRSLRCSPRVNCPVCGFAHTTSTARSRRSARQAPPKFCRNRPVSRGERATRHSAIPPGTWFASVRREWSPRNEPSWFPTSHRREGQTTAACEDGRQQRDDRVDCGIASTPLL